MSSYVIKILIYENQSELEPYKAITKNFYKMAHLFFLFFFVGLLYTKLTFGLAGKFFITLAYDVIYTWTVELYPTQIRYCFFSVYCVRI